MDVPTWSQLLTALGEVPYASARGTVRWREPDDDDLDVVAGEGEADFWFAAPDRWRVEDAQGPVLVQDTRWTYRRDRQGRLQREPREPGSWPGDPLDGLGSGADRAEQFDRGSNDFSQPLGPAEPSTAAGRPAWAVVLAPPAHKPHPLSIVLDRETGTLLRMSLLDGRYVREMTRFEPGAPVDPERFTWSGPYDTGWHDERTGWERARTWAAREAVPVPRWWPAGLGHEAQDGDPDTGTFLLHLQVEGEPALARWPRGGTPPHLWRLHSERRHAHRWADEAWEWGLAVDVPLSDADLERVVASMTTP